MAAGTVQIPLAGGNLHGLQCCGSGGARGEALAAIETCTLHRQSLAHDGATAAQNLQIGHSSTSGAAVGTSSSREIAEGGGGCPFEERTHRTRLLQESLHLEIGAKAKEIKGLPVSQEF